ncbi:hypothetical protein [Georgenia subflava]|uniref:hypothetical protein n=1 Tax=Georgenia subflava TaxID=1622177 RepID=UPI00186B4514|nr:hypothetical protein [Georgenia subflava]
MSYYSDTTHHVLHQIHESELARRTGEIRMLAELRGTDRRSRRRARSARENLA